MSAPQLPKSIDRKMEILHLSGHSITNEAFWGRKSAVCIAFKTMEPASLGDFTRVDSVLHCPTEALKICLRSRWNFPC